MGPLAEVGTDQQRFLKAPEQFAGGTGERVFPLLGQIDPQTRERVDPHVCDNQVEHDEGCRQDHPAAMRLRPRACAPAHALQRGDVEGQKDTAHGQIVDQVTEIDHAALDARETAARADGTEHGPNRATHEVSHTTRSQQVKKTADQHSQDKRNDLVIGPR